MSDKAPDILVGELAGQTLGEGLVVLPGQGNSLAIETDDGTRIAIRRTTSR